jgi:hypothetical protein
MLLNLFLAILLDSFS